MSSKERKMEVGGEEDEFLRAPLPEELEEPVPEWQKNQKWQVRGDPQDEARGRYLVATQDLKEGEIVMEEKLLFSSLQLGLSTSICAHSPCHLYVASRYPLSCLCARCESVVYCSRECWNADTGHDEVDCALKMIFRLMQARHQILHAQAPLFKEDRDENEDPEDQIWETLQEHLQRILTMVSWWLRTPSESPEKLEFSQLHGARDLLRPEQKPGHQSLVQMTRAIFSQLRQLFPHLCQQNERLDQLEEEGRLGDLIVKTWRNAFSLPFITDLPELAQRWPLIGTGVFLKMSLLNHSCQPNCGITIQHGKAFISTLRPVAQNEELNLSYVNPAASREERQSTLWRRYRFHCTCPLCSSSQNE